MGNEFRRATVPYTPQEEEDDGLPWYVFGAARRAALAARKDKSKGAPAKVVQDSMPGSNMSTGNKPKTLPPAAVANASAPAPKRQQRAQMPAPAPTPMPQREMMDSGSGVTNPAEFAPGRMPSMPQAEEPTPGRTQNFEESSPAPESPRMRKGFFGEDISEEDWKRMEEKNKEGSFWGRFAKGGEVKRKKTGMKPKASGASKRGDGCATRGKTRGRMV